jgi:glycine cleavage system H protein
MKIPDDLLYTDQHEWIRVEGDTGTIGITDFAQDQLGDITFVEVPPIGKSLAKGDELGAIESCKAAASVYAPTDGEVTEVNEALEADPAVVNSDPYGEGWICRITIARPGELSELMNPEQYREFCGKEH